MEFTEPTDYFDPEMISIVTEMSVESLVMLFALVAIELEKRGVMIQGKKNANS